MRTNNRKYLIIGIIILITMPTALSSSDNLQLSDLQIYKKGNPKFDSQINELLSNQINIKYSIAHDSIEENSLKVMIDLKEYRPEYIETLKNNGLDIQISDKNLIQAIVPIDKLETVAGLSFVDNIHSPIKYHTSVVSEGINTISATKLHNIGYNGSRVKIGIIDLGFQNYQSSLGKELPLNTVVKSFSDKGLENGVIHGVAVAEVMHDVAPGAQLFLTNFETDLEFKQAVDWLISQNVSIISASVGKPIGPKDGTDYTDKVIDNATKSGIFWVNSAGNDAKRHWTGKFYDPDNDKILNFNSTDEANHIFVHKDQEITILLDWNDWPKSSQDYDLVLLDDSDNIVSSSVATQNGTQRPYEIIMYKSKYTGIYRIAIVKYNAIKDVKFHLYIYGTSSNIIVRYTVPSGSISIPTTDSSLMVGATNWSNDILEYYSSQGPTDDGRIKPDVVAPSDVTNSIYGKFRGTSASAPHVAGVAALLLDKDSNLNNIRLKNAIEYGAKDLGKPGKDNKFGIGRIDAYKSANITNKDVLGDINGDKKITESDALLYLRYGVEQDISPYSIIVSDDVTCDGRITASDALKILRKSVGQNVDLVCT